MVKYTEYKKYHLHHFYVDVSVVFSTFTLLCDHPLAGPIIGWLQCKIIAWLHNHETITHCFPLPSTHGNHPSTFFLFLFIFYFYLFLDRRGEGESEGEKHQCVFASCTPSTGDLTLNPGMCPDWELNQQPFALWDNAQPNEPQWLGQSMFMSIIHIVACV